MNNETLIRKLIKGSIQRAIQESVAAAVVVITFMAILTHSEVGSPRYFGCIILLVGTGFITGVIWSYALSYQLLRSHSPGDVEFWREAFHAQAKLLRLVPLWYAAPIYVGGISFSAPTSSSEMTPFILTVVACAGVFAFVTILNRRAADQLDSMAAQLA
jgi:hypothetical protein